MTLDGGWGLIIATIIGVILVWIGTMAGGHFSNAKDRGEAAHGRIDEIQTKVEENEKEFLRFQTEVAQTYARISGVERMETNIFAVLARLEVKIDKLKEPVNG